MPEPTTPNKGYTIPNTGDLNNAWGPVNNGNFSLIDSNLAGSLSIALTNGGTLVLTSAQAANLAITLTGALTAASVVQVPQVGGFYLFNNASTGSQTVTVQTGAAGGTTVVLPSGWTTIFSNGTNCYFLGQPATIPVPLTEGGTGGTSAPTARTNLGVTATGQDTTYAYRANNLSDLANLANALANLGGAPLASPALTGTPTAPTAPAGTSTTQLATTQFANPSQSLAASGYVELPGGLIIQWGSVTTNSNGGFAGLFPTPFSSAVFNMQVTYENSTTASFNFVSGAASGTTTFSVTTVNANGIGTSAPVFWMAIGL